MPRRRRSIDFDIWGCRGSRNLVPGTSKIGNNTSCYSCLVGEDLYVFDAGRGLTRLGRATQKQRRFAVVRRIHILVTHAHMDHWEGLKDVEWFWLRNNGLQVRLYGTNEALGAIRKGFSHPSYVPLERLSVGMVEEFGSRRLRAGQDLEVGACRVRTVGLHHYSGDRSAPQYLDTIGFLVRPDEDGPTVAYVSDHEPTAKTQALENEIAREASITLFDSHFIRVKDQAYGHGSQEHTARIARSHRGNMVLAGHLNPNLSDEEIQRGCGRYLTGLDNFALAKEGTTYRWNPSSGRFEARS